MEEACLLPKVKPFSHVQEPITLTSWKPYAVFISLCVIVHKGFLNSSHNCYTNFSFLWLKTFTVIMESVDKISRDTDPAMWHILVWWSMLSHSHKASPSITDYFSKHLNMLPSISLKTSLNQQTETFPPFHIMPLLPYLFKKDVCTLCLHFFTSLYSLTSYHLFVSLSAPVTAPY